MQKSDSALNSIGKEFKQNSGHIARVIDVYRDSKYRYYRVDVQFEDGSVVKNKLYSELVKGRVGKPKDLSKLVGESRINNTGDLVTILEAHTKSNITVQFCDGTIKEKVNYSSFLDGSIRHPNYMQRKYIGETNIAKNGMKMEIIGVNNFKDITIRFEDGTIVEHKVYSDFKSGMVGHPKTLYGKIDHTNETIIAKNGLKATIINYKSVNDFDVEFEDGVVVHCKYYYKFVKGIIKHPHIKGRQCINRLGEKGINKNGKRMTIVRFGGATDIDVQFEDGTIIKNRTYFQFKNGLILQEKACRVENFLDRVGEQSISKSGHKMVIVAYRKSSDIDIQFEDGAIAKHRSYRHFKNGSISHPNDAVQIKDSNGTPINKRVGEQAMNYGMLMTIKNYRSSRDIDIELKDGTVLKHQVYRQFKQGKIGKRLCADKIRVGETSIASNGMKITIIKYTNYNNITVQFEDGAIYENTSYGSFKRGSIMHPNTKQEIQSREGRTIKLKLGLDATIINYNNAKDMEVMLEDGTILKRDFDEFSSGIKHPKYKICKHIATFKNEKVFLCTCKKCKGKHVLKLSEMKKFECNRK